MKTQNEKLSKAVDTAEFVKHLDEVVNTLSNLNSELLSEVRELDSLASRLYGESPEDANKEVGVPRVGVLGEINAQLDRYYNILQFIRETRKRLDKL